MKRKAFTLLELLLVIAIMGYMGTIAVGGYRAMRRGMEERSVMQNVSQFIRTAYQRAQIDRQPVDVYFWNETIREATDEEPLQVVGRAVAVRRSGRITRVTGSKLYDEFADLRYSKLSVDEDQQSSSTLNLDDGMGVFLYAMDGTGSGSQVARSTVSAGTVKDTLTIAPLIQGGMPQDLEDYAYVLKDPGSVTWKTGMAYGFEFADLQLPHNYIFGSAFSRSVRTPVAGESVMRFVVGANTGSGATGGTSGSDTIPVYSLRPGSSGALSAQRVGVSEKPTSDLNN